MQNRDEADIHKNVVTLFRMRGYQNREYLDQETVKKVLNERSQKVLERPFKRELFEQLIEKCKESLSLNSDNFGEIVSTAYEKLLKNIHDAEKQDGYLAQLQAEINRLQKNIVLKEEPSSPEKQPKLENILEMEYQVQTLKEQKAEIEHNVVIFKAEAIILRRVFLELDLNSSQEVPQQKKIEIDIHAKIIPKIVFINFLGIFLQAFVSHIRPSFFSLLFYIHTFYFTFVGYYNFKAGMMLIVQNLLSVLADSTYLVLVFLKYLNPWKQPLTIQPTFILIFIILLAISIILRIVELIFLIPFKQPPHESSLMQYKICGRTFKLRKRTKTRKTHRYSI